MDDITTSTKEQEFKSNCDNSNATKNDGGATTMTMSQVMQPAFIEINSNLTISNDASFTAVEEAQTMSTTLDNSAFPKGEDVEEEAAAAATSGTSTVPPMQDEMEVENSTEPALLTPSGGVVQVAVNGSSTSSNAISGGGGGGSMEVASQIHDKGPNNAISFIEMKSEEGDRSLIEKSAEKTEEHCDIQNHEIGERRSSSVGLVHGRVNVVMEMPPRGSDAITTTIYDGKVGISRGWVHRVALYSWFPYSIVAFHLLSLPQVCVCVQFVIYSSIE